MLFETDVPVPPARGGIQYPFSKLAPGQSVLYPCTDLKDRAKARKAAHRVADYHGWAITVRSLPDGVRVWRHK